jgi:hypothetical protein
MNRMPRIDRHSVDADGVVKAAMLEAFLAALVAVRTQRLAGRQSRTSLDRCDRLDVVGDAGGDELGFVTMVLVLLEHIFNNGIGTFGAHIKQWYWYFRAPNNGCKAKVID